MPDTKYKICPRCNYIVQAQSPGRFCINCGHKLIKDCPGCQASIANPFAQYCPECGHSYRIQDSRRGPKAPKTLSALDKKPFKKEV